MKSDISNHVAACSACTQPRQKLDKEKKPTDAGTPMEELRVDYFDVLGTNWLVAVDRYSGYAWTAKISKATTENTFTQLVACFDEFGWPKKIRSDGGPQFRQAFTSFCKLHGISHELASAYNLESNGLAEAAVKSMKALVVRTKKLGENLRQAIVCWRNVKRQNGTSPAELFWGRTQRHRLPIHNGSQRMCKEATGPAQRDDFYSKQVKARNQHTTDYLPLQPGDTALLAEGTTGKWTKEVSILSTNPSGKSYQVQDNRGHTYTRGRELLRKRIRQPNQEPALTSRQFKETDLINPTEQKNAGLQLRRRARLRRRLLEDTKNKHDKTASQGTHSASLTAKRQEDQAPHCQETCNQPHRR